MPCCSRCKAVFASSGVARRAVIAMSARVGSVYWSAGKDRVVTTLARSASAGLVAQQPPERYPHSIREAD